MNVFHAPLASGWDRPWGALGEDQRKGAEEGQDIHPMAAFLVRLPPAGYVKVIHCPCYAGLHQVTLPLQVLITTPLRPKGINHSAASNS